MHNTSTSDDTTPSKQHSNAATAWSPVQRAIAIGFVLGNIALAALSIESWFLAASFLSLGVFGAVVCVKTLAVVLGLASRFTINISPERLNAIDDEALPIYTLLIPLYREANVVPALIDAIGKLDYPPNKLDVKCLVESEDQETLQALKQFEDPLRPWLDICIVPAPAPGTPQTKPRACNFGLESAKGEFLVIFDAEDRPEPDQLKKAVIAFEQQTDDVICLQAKLNFYNPTQNLLTRWFTLEYSAWFDLYLSGLHAIGSPIPLGGTSNHFRTDALRQLGGWDAYNVTEDCDLGIRISRAKQSVRILESTTWEEAVSKPSVWIKQRSRWIKGYWQTWLVHSRHPLNALKELGLWKLLLMHFIVGGQVLTLLASPFSWVVFAYWCVWQWDLFYPESPSTIIWLMAAVGLILFNGFYLFIHVLGAIKRRYWQLIPATLIMPLYWALMSLGAWRGVLQYLWAPFHWEKTPHGLDNQQSEKPLIEKTARSNAFLGRGISMALIAVIALLILTPLAYKIPARIRQAQIDFAGDSLALEKPIHASWSDKTHIYMTIQLPSNNAFDIGDIRLLNYIKVLDGQWYQFSLDSFTIEKNKLHVTLPLNQQWQGLVPDIQWSPDHLRRVLAFGVKVFSKKLNHNKEALQWVSFEVQSKQVEKKPAPLSINLLPTVKTNENSPTGVNRKISPYTVVEKNFSLSLSSRNLSW